MAQGSISAIAAKEIPTSQMVTTRAEHSAGTDRLMCNTWPRPVSKDAIHSTMAATDLFCNCGRDVWRAKKKEVVFSGSQLLVASNAVRSGKKSTEDCNGAPAELSNSPPSHASQGDCPTSKRVEAFRSTLGTSDSCLQHEKQHSAAESSFSEGVSPWRTKQRSLKSDRRATKQDGLGSTESLDTAMTDLASLSSGCSASKTSLNGGCSNDSIFCSAENLTSSPAVKEKAKLTFSLEGKLRVTANRASDDEEKERADEVPDEVRDMATPPQRNRSMSYQGLIGHKLGKIFTPTPSKSRSQTTCQTRGKNATELLIFPRPSVGLRQAVSADNLLQMKAEQEVEWNNERDCAEDVGHHADSNMFADRAITTKQLKTGSDRQAPVFVCQTTTTNGRSRGAESPLGGKMLSVSSTDLHSIPGKTKRTLLGFFSNHEVLRRSMTFSRREPKGKSKEVTRSPNKLVKRTTSKEVEESHSAEHTAEPCKEYRKKERSEACADAHEHGELRKDGQTAETETSAVCGTHNEWQQEPLRKEDARHSKEERQPAQVEEESLEQTSSVVSKLAHKGGAEEIDAAPRFLKRTSHSTTSCQARVCQPVCGKCLSRRRAVFAMAWFRECQEPSSPMSLMMGPNEPVTEETFTTLATLVRFFPGGFASNINLVRHRRTGERFTMKKVPCSSHDAENAKHARVMHTCLVAVHAPFVSTLFFSWLARPPFEPTKAHVSVSELCHGGSLQNYMLRRVTRLPESDVSQQ